MLGLTRQHSRQGDALARGELGGEPEAAALAGGAVDPDFAAHQPGQPAGDGEPEAGAAVLAGGGDIGLLEGLEQLLALELGDADAAVLYLEAQQIAADQLAQHPHPQGDGARIGELDGIAGIVEQGLAQPGDVAVEPDRGAAEIDLNVEPLGASLLVHQGTDVIQHGDEGEVVAFQHHLARVYLGEIQDVVDQGEQVLGRVVYLLQPIVLGDLLGIPLEQVGEAQDGIHGGADLVAHVGEEGALGLVGAFGALMGLRQLLGALADHLLQVEAVLIQLLPELLLLGDVGLHRHEVRHLGMLPSDGRDGGHHLIVGTILAPVGELPVPALALLEGIPQGDMGGRRGEAGVEQLGGLPQHLLLLVAAGGQEGGVDIFDAGCRVGDEDPVRALLQGQ
ncbi:hypothetical protein D3C78_812840 [compost metagenome]